MFFLTFPHIIISFVYFQRCIYIMVKSLLLQGSRTAWVKPFWYLNRITSSIGTPLPVFEYFFADFFVLSTPIWAALRAFLAALALAAPIPKKFYTKNNVYHVWENDRFDNWNTYTIWINLQFLQWAYHFSQASIYLPSRQSNH